MSKIKISSQSEALQGENLQSTTTASTTVINIDSPKRSQKPRFLGRQSSFGLGPQSNGANGVFGSNSWKKAYMWVWSGSRYSGVACMLVSSAAYSLMGLFVKLLAGKSQFQKTRDPKNTYSLFVNTGSNSSCIILSTISVWHVLSFTSVWVMKCQS